MKRRLIATGLLLVLPAFALADGPTERVLNKKDDIDFAKALVANGYPDLAERLLVVVEKTGATTGPEAKAIIDLIKLDVAQDLAMKIEDLVKRKDELVKVLTAKEKFIETYKGTQASEDCRNGLPDLYGTIGETITSAIKKLKDEKVLEALRSEGDGLFLRAEAASKQRIEELKGIQDKDDETEFKLQSAYYNYARTLYLHSLLFSPGSGKRIELCNAALTEFGEFELNYTETLLNIYASIDTGLCLKEIGKPSEAIASIDQAIAVRESWGEKQKVVGPDNKPKMVWPLTDRSIVDIVCYGMLQKMLILKEMKKTAEVIAVGQDFFDSTPEPWESPSSMVVAREVADAQFAAGDVKASIDTGKEMIKIDPAGIGAAWGREIVDRAGGGTYLDKMKTAEARVAANDLDRGIAIARQVIAETAGTPDEQEAGCDSLLLIGFAYQKRGWFEEAALAYQTAVDRYPKAKNASEALVRAIDCYAAAQRGGKRRYYKEQINEGTNRLIRDYPKDPRASNIQLTKASILESEGDFLGAIEILKTVQPTADQYSRAKLMIGLDYFQHASKLASEKKEEEAKPFYPLTETAFKEAIAAIGAAKGKTIDPKVQAALEGQEYLARLSLARLYMLPAFGRIADAAPAIDVLEQGWAKDPQKGPDIQNLRGRLFLSQGKFEEAEKWVNDLYARDKIAASGPAGQLARALDQQGLDKFKEKPGSLEGEDLWKRAARFYYISIKPQVDGQASQNAGEMTDVGNRFFSYGLTFNGVPDSRVSFVDWVPGPKRALDYWVKAAEIYEAALAQTPDYRMTINLGRTYGFLGEYVKAAGIYARLFEQEALVNPKAPNRLDNAVQKAKPELVYAYLEWGVSERLSYAKDNDKSRLTRALRTIFTPLLQTLKPDTSPETYWATRYHLIRALMDNGDYKDAQLNVQDAQRNISATFDDGKYGYKALFETTIEELKKKF
jgi:tetratricopeptide (TPR) repeat protein